MSILKANFWTSLGDWAVSTGWTLVNVVCIIAGAVLVSWLLRVIIRRVVKQIVSGVKKGQSVTDTQALVASPLAAVRVVQRTRTLGSVLSNIVNVTIGIIAIVLIFGVVAPGAASSLALLTAAIGAGLGFGAQNIVKDVLNGLFMVMEDQLGVGDVVDLGPATGVVEGVGIRITQVRDVNGVLWFVRNGEILRVGNMSQGWSRVIVDLAVPYDADIETVEAKMMEAATALATSPKWRSRILDKPELWGLESISAEAIVIRIVLKTRTTAKDDVSRELRLRLKQATDELGVTLPSLSAVVLSGFDGAGSVGGAKPPRTRPTPVVPDRPLTGRKARAAAKRTATRAPDPGAIRIRPAIETKPGTTVKPASTPAKAAPATKPSAAAKPPVTDDAGATPPKATPKPRTTKPPAADQPPAEEAE
ncbi:mechanosensitive ion channel domain-containing protein [Leifsonia sp. NPDC056824]|uniref:mechanosensitive ion channel family protein n=1 Tax=Leifsonia sp. NPDC056824 TaxID=3345953 RepID=UPI0036C97D36